MCSARGAVDALPARKHLISAQQKNHNLKRRSHGKIKTIPESNAQHQEQ